MSYKNKIETCLNLAAKARKDPERAIKYIGKRLLYRYRKYSGIVFDFFLGPIEKLISIYDFFVGKGDLESLFQSYSIIDSDKPNLVCVGFCQEENTYLYLKYQKSYNVFFTAPLTLYLAQNRLIELTKKSDIKFKCKKGNESNSLLKKVQTRNHFDIEFESLEIDDSERIKIQKLSLFFKYYKSFDINLTKQVGFAIDTTSIAAFSNSPTIGKLVDSLHKKDHLTLYTNSHYNYSAFLKEEWAKLVDIKWLSRAYYKPNGDIEKVALDIISEFTGVYEGYLRDKFGDNLDAELFSLLSSAFCLELEDRFFNKAVGIVSLVPLSKQYDSYIIDGTCIRDDLVFYQLLLNSLNADRVFFVFPKRYSKVRILKLLEILNKDIEIKSTGSKVAQLNLQKLVTEKTSHKIKSSKKARVLVSGNVDNENYAYSPTVFEILEVLEQQNINTDFLTAKDTTHFDEKQYKTYFKSRGLNSTGLINVFYNLNKKANRKLNYEFVNYFTFHFSNAESFNSYLFLYFRSDIENLAYYFARNIQLLLNSVEVLKEQGCIGFVTALERNSVSRITVAACRVMEIKTVGIQGQLVSSSKRYKEPVTDYFLVIDELQRRNHVRLGYEPKNTYLVGSANYRKNLKKISHVSNEDNNFFVTLILQHSMIDSMFDIFKATYESCQRLGLFLYIKPHPNQESELIKLINSHMVNNSAKSQAVLLNKNDDTYHYVSQADLVVGLFSNVLLESLLADKDVIIYAKESIDPAIDFSEKAGGLKVSNPKELEEAITDLLNPDKIVPSREVRKHYIANNPQYYSTDYLKEALNKCLELPQTRS